MVIESAADLAAYFDTDEFAVSATIGATTLPVMITYDAEVVDADGGLIEKTNTVTTPDESLFTRGVAMVVGAQTWSIGKLLETSPDGVIKTFEITKA